MAGQIKVELERYGFDVFLAHEDVKVTAEWEKEILRQLHSCELFIALLTKDFAKSHWTHQEVGIAYSKGCVMVPIKADRSPVGFMAKYQAIGLDTHKVDHTAWKIVESISQQNPRLKREIRWALIRQVGDAPSFIDAGWIVKKLADLNGLKPTEMETVLQLAAGNDQVYGSYLASRPLRELINKHKKSIGGRVLRRFLDAWTYGL